MFAKMTLPPQAIEAKFSAETADKEARVVPVTWYTGATVLQFSWEKGLHNLTLVMDPDKVDMGRLESGAAPFTRGHSSPSDPGAVLGKVVKASLDAKAGTALVRFSKRADVEPIFQDVLDGILTNVSMEASIHKMKEVTKEGESMRSFVATQWEPTCIALVAQGADPGARINAAAEVQTECEIELADQRASAQEDKQMENTSNTGEQARNDEAVKLAAATAERERVIQISGIGETGKLEAKLVAEHIAKGTSVEEFRRLAFEALAARSEQNATATHANVTRDEADTRRLGFTQALLHRSGETMAADAPGREYLGVASQGLLSVAAEICRVNGKNPNRMNKSEIAKFALSTSDLPYILANTADKSMMNGYKKYESKWPLISTKRSAPNFKEQTLLELGTITDYDQVPESGEFKLGYVSESKEVWKLLTYGKRIAFTRQTIINDDLNALTSVPQDMGRKAAQKQATLVWGLVTTNKMSDASTDLFSTGHANYVSSGTAISVDNLGIARAYMRKQTDPSGDFTDLEPKYLVVPPAKEQLALQYCSVAYVPAESAKINVWAGSLTPIVEPRLTATSATAWYLFADPSAAPTIVYGYLEGNEGVFSESRNGFEVDGVEFKVRMDFGCAVVGYRGAFLNAGA